MTGVRGWAGKTVNRRIGRPWDHGGRKGGNRKPLNGLNNGKEASKNRDGQKSAALIETATEMETESESALEDGASNWRSNIRPIQTKSLRVCMYSQYRFTRWMIVHVYLIWHNCATYPCHTSSMRTSGLDLCVIVCVCVWVCIY